jgi:beta-glucanase (GH16 family)
MADTSTRSHSAGGEIIFFEDFTSEYLDRSNWNVRTTGPVYNNEQQAYVDSLETIHIDQLSPEGNGLLAIQPCYRPGFVTAEGNRFDFISGRIDSREKMECQYGTISARIKLSISVGVWPAFWMNGSGDWPHSGEIDIMESVGDPGWVNSAVHGPGYSGDGAPVKRFHFPAAKDGKGWHIYALEWTPDFLSFKVDEQPFFKVERSTVGSQGPWMFDNQKHIILNVALGGLYPFKVNGFRSPYLGLPEETVQLIRREEIRMLVDWVKVVGM